MTYKLASGVLLGIVDFSDGSNEEYRKRLLDRLRKRRDEDPGYRVVDIGGGHNPWADEVVDAYVDVFEFETDKPLYVGDINDDEIWRTLQLDGVFDFAIVSHVLEDIRNPMMGLKWLPLVAKSGFLGLPVKHREFANNSSPYWLGQSHHCWIFGVKQDESGESVLIAVPKWHCINYFNDQIGVNDAIDEDGEFGRRRLGWFDPDKTGNELELGVVWEGSLPYWVPEYTYDDATQIEIYRTVFAEGV